MSWEREFYAVAVRNAVGWALRFGNRTDGPSFLRDPYTSVAVSEGFSLQSVGPKVASRSSIVCSFARLAAVQLVHERRARGRNAAAATRLHGCGHLPEWNPQCGRRAGLGLR